MTGHFKNSLSTSCTPSANAILPLKLCRVTDVEVVEIIINLKNKKSAGNDNIPITLIYNISLESIPYLRKLVNISVCSGKFLNWLKTSLIFQTLKQSKKLYTILFKLLSCKSCIHSYLQFHGKYHFLH